MTEDRDWPDSVEIQRLKDELARANRKIGEIATTALDWRDTARDYRKRINAVQSLIDGADPGRTYPGPWGGNLFHEQDIRKALESGTPTESGRGYRAEEPLPGRPELITTTSDEESA